MDASVEETPLTIVWKRLLDDDATLVAMIDVVPMEPPRLEVRTLELVVSVFEAVRLVIVAEVIVVVASDVSPRTVSVPFEDSDDVAVTIPLVTCPVVSVVNTADAAERSEEKKPVLEVLLVKDAFDVVREAMEVVASVVSPENVLSPAMV